MNNLDTKNKGQVYTPISIVNMMLDYAGYVSGEYILHKHVIDNSCGDGRILCEVVKRYIESYKPYGILSDKFVRNIVQDDNIRGELKEYIHGIDCDYDACCRCRENLNDILKSYHLKPIEWDIRPVNALAKSTYDYDNFQGKMDFVFGNPPYVRMKNIKKSDEDNFEYQVLKSYSFAERGMSDLYLAFYELGLEMRNLEGVLCYIAPSSWVNSQSGMTMRKYVEETRELAGVIDFGHTKVFDNATTYVMITLFDNKPHKFIRYDTYDDEKKTIHPELVIDYDKLFINGKMYFLPEEDYNVLKEVSKPHKKVVEVKNGYATLADDVFIGELPDLNFEHYVIPIVKGSTGQIKRCLFPYDRELKLIPLERIKYIDPKVYTYLLENQETLKKRDYDTKGVEGTWHSFGRSQGLKDTYTERIGINSLVRDPHDVRLYHLEPKWGIYSGLYIKTDIPIFEIDKVLCDWDFINYVKSLRKYKSGGYYTFSSKDLENYLNYKLG